MSFTCPACGRTSRHPGDCREGYCSRCHQWTRDSSGPYLFGGWDLAVLDAGTLVAAPLGEPCGLCGQPIGVDDQGYLRPVLGTAAGMARIRAVHADCETVRVQIARHDHGVCTCAGWDTTSKATGDESGAGLRDVGF